MTNDPEDDSFWHIAEYFEPSRRDVVANFTLQAPEPDDIGVLSVDAPVSGSLTDAESITVTIRNFGSNDITDPMVQYTIDGGAPVTEQFSGTISAGTNESYTFTETADLSTGSSFVICGTTSLAGDTDTSNDESCVTVVNTGNLECTDFTNTDQQPVGPNAGDVTESIITVGGDAVIGDVNVTINVEHTWDGDLDIELINPDGDIVSLASDVGGQDDNFTNTTFDDDAAIAIADGTAPFTGSFQPAGSLADFNGTSSAGDWTLRITDNVNADGGTLLDWTLELCTDEVLSTDEIPDTLGDAAFTVIERDENIFDISLRTAFDGNAAISVFNIIGQQLVFNNLDKEGDAFNYQLDMSFAATGVYIVQFGDVNGGATVSRKIIVK